MPSKLNIAGREVGRVGITLAALRTTGMWGEPADRSTPIEVIRAAIKAGIDLIEVPVPFGPWADLLRQAGVDGDTVLVVARLTGASGPKVLASRLGRLRPGLVLAAPERLDEVQGWDLAPVGAVIGRLSRASDLDPIGRLAAVRGPLPPPDEVFDRTSRGAVPYLASSLEALACGSQTGALIPVRAVSDIERLTAEPG